MVPKVSIVNIAIMNIEDFFLLSSIILVIIGIILLACKLLRELEICKEEEEEYRLGKGKHQMEHLSIFYF